MKTIIAVDPGTTESGVIFWDGGPKIEMARKMPNDELLSMLRMQLLEDCELHIEMIASYGMAVGKEVFETCVWIGRFQESFKGRTSLVYRRDIKLHHCGQARAKDGEVAQALRDKYGVKGTKAAPGFFYGFSADVWQAFALSAYVVETNKKSV